jgi:hypothetical protein
MGFIDVFSGHGTGPTTGGGVTPGQEPWLGSTPPTTVTISREPKPMILYAGIADATEAALFLATMSAILAVRSGGGEVRAGTGIVQQEFGIRWYPDFGKMNFGSLSIALENAGFDPTKCALQSYDPVSSGPSGIVKYHGPSQLVVRLVHGAQTYEGVHDTQLCLNSPMVFATEIKTFMRL